MSDTPKASDNEDLLNHNEVSKKVPANETSKEIAKEAKAKKQVSESNNSEISETSRKHFKYRSNKCLNCSQPLDLSDRYCPYCSQLNSTKQLSFGDFFKEFFSSLVSYDSRLWFTLKHLLLRPGTITKCYVEGHRLRYANPFRFFLSVSIIYFLLSGFINFLLPNNDFDFAENDDDIVKISTIENNYGDDIEIENTTEAEEIYVSNPNWEEEVAGAFNDSTALKTETISNKPPKISEVKESQRQIDTTTIKEKTDSKTKKYISEQELQKLNWAQRHFDRFTTYNDFWEETEIKNAGRALDSLNHLPSRFNLWLYEKNNSIDRIKEYPKKFINYLSAKVPLFLFFFAPLFALFFWLIYSKKTYSYMEHLVFIFHIFSFIFLSMIIAIIPDMLIGSGVFTAILFIFIGPFYFYKALRNFYKQSRLITIIKFVFLNHVFLFAASLSAVFFFAITAATY